MCDGASGRRADRTGRPVIDAFVHVTHGRLHLLRNDLVSARRDLQAAQALVGHLAPVNPSALPWRSLAGVIAHRCGEDEVARELFDDEVRLASRFDVPVALGVALRRRGLTETGDEACRTFEEAVAVLDGSDATLQIAYAQAGLGRAFRLIGQRASARTHLAIGLDLAHRCGASSLEARCVRARRRGGTAPSARSHRRRVIDPGRGFGGEFRRTGHVEPRDRRSVVHYTQYRCVASAQRLPKTSDPVARTIAALSVADLGPRKMSRRLVDECLRSLVARAAPQWRVRSCAHATTYDRRG